VSLQAMKSSENDFLIIFSAKDLVVKERKCTFALAFVKTEAKKEFFEKIT